MAEQILNLKESKNIHSASYDADTMTLTVRFHKGGSYSYSGVDEAKAQAFADADSHGSFLHANIKNQHIVTKIG
jgi:hypothetical protein